MNLTPNQIALQIKIPLKKWPGNCMGIAMAIVKAKLFAGKAVYGIYHGPISEDCERFYGRGFTHHGWIQDSKRIVDPTRWVFEAKKPYIYTTDLDDEDYDFGGNRVRRSMMKPFPDFNPEQRQWPIPKKLRAMLESLCGAKLPKTICSWQVMWFANLSPDMLQDYALPIFTWICEIDCTGFIPIDNYRLIFDE